MLDVMRTIILLLLLNHFLPLPWNQRVKMAGFVHLFVME
jgi:hypothetical protein